MAETVISVSASIGVASFSVPHRRRPLDMCAKAGRHYDMRLYSQRRLSKFTMCSNRNKDFDDCRPKGESHAWQMELPGISRRGMLFVPLTLFTALEFDLAEDGNVSASDFVDMPALRGKDYGKPKMRFPDYTLTESGLQYKDLRQGSGPTPREGDTVVVDWDGYTIGYYGRIFEARNKAKGGSFEGNDKAYLRIQLGTHEVIPAFEEALATMKLGCVRRIIVPPELGYPDNDFNKKGPKPMTFSGQRALAFVLQNQNLIDKTLLFDIELLKISPT